MNTSLAEKNLTKSITRGVKESIPSIIMNEVWNAWETNASLTNDDVSKVELESVQNMFGGTMQRMEFTTEGNAYQFRTSMSINEKLVITYFDGEATMLLYEEAEEIFGDNLKEYLNMKESA